MTSNENCVWRVMITDRHSRDWRKRDFENFRDAWNFYQAINGELRLIPYPVSVFDLIKEQSDGE